jgi:hypothetical protein
LDEEEWDSGRGGVPSKSSNIYMYMSTEEVMKGDERGRKGAPSNNKNEGEISSSTERKKQRGARTGFMDSIEQPLPPAKHVSCVLQ